VLRKGGPINAKFMKSLVKKHKQRGSTKKAMKETADMLHELNMRVYMPIEGITSIGERCVHQKDIYNAMTWSDRLRRANTVLKVYMLERAKNGVS
jgi:acetate kinase